MIGDERLPVFQATSDPGQITRFGTHIDDRGQQQYPVMSEVFYAPAEQAEQPTIHVPIARGYSNNEYVNEGVSITPLAGLGSQIPLLPIPRQLVFRVPIPEECSTRSGRLNCIDFRANGHPGINITDAVSSHLKVDDPEEMVCKPFADRVYNLQIFVCHCPSSVRFKEELTTQI